MEITSILDSIKQMLGIDLLDTNFDEFDLFYTDKLLLTYLYLDYQRAFSTKAINLPKE